jgi:hypothetical protein
MSNAPTEKTPEPHRNGNGNGGPWQSRLAENFLKFVNGLTNEKLLLLALLFLLGWSQLAIVNKASDRETFQARQTEESRIEAQRHCDSREELMRRELTNFFAAQAEIQRRHDSEREDKMRLAFETRTEQLRVMLISLTSRLSELERMLRKN